MRGIKRKAAVVMAVAAAAGGVGLATAGTASASEGGGCDGPRWKEVCVRNNGDGAVGFSAKLDINPAHPNCYADLSLYDLTDQRWVIGTKRLSGCRNGSAHRALSNPKSGHTYSAAMGIHWEGNDSQYDLVWSPDLKW